MQHRPGVTSTLIGPRSHDHLVDNLAALDLTLTAEQTARLDEVSAPTLNFPSEVNTAMAPTLQYAGTTVNGQPSTVHPMLLKSPVRY